MTMIMLFLFATGLFAGTVDAIAGGGGLISLPVLLSLGIPPHIAFGTNKLQSTIGTLVAARRYHGHGLISLKTGYKGLIFGVLGSVSGSVATQILSTEILLTIIPAFLLMLLVYAIFSPRLGSQDTKPRMSEKWFYPLFGFALGFYDGFFGPGVGSFWVFMLTFLLGYNLIKATAYTKLFNLNSNLISLICFAIGGNIDYRFGLCMAAGQLIGGRLGANLAIKNGSRLIRPIFLCVVGATIATLIYKNYSSSDMFIRLTQQLGIVSQILVVMTVVFSMLMIYLRNRRQKRVEM